ncbi:MAG TPA: 2TM domain-containing protein [Kineosporiaceae bacterium]|nr:2TM domain-containing protein [Kineosporiaceae bacterium]
MSDAWGTEPGGPQVRKDGTEDSEQWTQARRRVEKRRKLASDIVAYLVVNAFLIGVWAMTGRGYFWPAWVLGGWGIGLVLSGWEVYGRKPVTTSEIRDELGRLSQ